MNKEEILKILKEQNEIYSDEYLQVDNAIKPLVDYLNSIGLYTVASCCSHIKDDKGNNVYDRVNEAYVYFYYPNENYKNYLNFKNTKFPKSKYYTIKFDSDDNLKHNKDTIRIQFKTRKNRIIYLKNIYRALNIEIEDTIKLDIERQYSSPFRHESIKILNSFYLYLYKDLYLLYNNYVNTNLYYEYNEVIKIIYYYLNNIRHFDTLRKLDNESVRKLENYILKSKNEYIKIKEDINYHSTILKWYKNITNQIFKEV